VADERGGDQEVAGINGGLFQFIRECRESALGHETTVVLLPGMAADERLFEPQRRSFPGLIVPPWIEPEPCEPLASYARRMAARLDASRPNVIGGVSFGGIVALEMAEHLGLAECVLISSIRAPAEMPWRLRVLRSLATFGPDRLGVTAGWAARWLAPSMPRATARRLGRLAAPQSAFLRWACWAVLHWQPTPGARRTRVRQIHGSADRTFPIRYTHPNQIITGGGHLLTLTHPAEVNEFLEREGFCPA
jgi:pimeloyl-ACP methyl ester carboxylesterase